VVLVDEPVLADLGECVHCISTLDAGSEKTSEKDERKEAMSEAQYNFSVSIMICHVSHCDYCLLRSSKQVKGKPEKNAVNNIGVVAMECEPVGTDTRRLVKLLSLLLVNESALDHPPTNDSLECPERQQTHQ
jgi:hypothetical protein